MNEPSTHKSLLNRLRLGDNEEAWTEFHARYGDLLWGFCKRMNLQDADCDDVIQEVWTSLSKALPNFDYDPAIGKFRGYLKTTTSRVIFRKKTQNRGETQLEHFEWTLANDPQLEQTWEAEWQQYHLRHAMSVIEGEFSEEKLAIFRAIAVHGEKAADIAQRFGLARPQRAYDIKSEILKRMKDLIGKQIEDEG